MYTYGLSKPNIGPVVVPSDIANPIQSIVDTLQLQGRPTKSFHHLRLPATARSSRQSQTTAKPTLLQPIPLR